MGNECADRLANRDKDESVVPAILHEHFIQGTKFRAQWWWKARYCRTQLANAEVQKEAHPTLHWPLYLMLHYAGNGRK